MNTHLLIPTKPIYNSVIIQIMNSSPRYELSKEDAQELQKATILFQLDHKIKETARQYIIQYRHANSPSTIQKSAGVAKCALFFAEKSECLYDMRGHKIQGIGLSLNQIIKTYPNIDEFIYILKDFIRKVRLPDLQVENDLRNLIERINFSMTFYNKFEKILKELSFTQKVNQCYGYSQIFPSFVWLLFVDSKAEMYGDERDMVKTTCLLATVFYSMIRYCLQYIKPLFLADVPDKINGNKNALTKVIGRITQKIFSLFSIQDYQTYKISVSDFDDYFQTLLQSNILKNTEGKIDFFSPQLININYKRLDALHQKRFSANDLDERFFLRERVTTLTPSKITPFEKQGVTIRSLRAKPNQRKENLNPNVVVTKNFYSHRVLQYQPSKELIQPRTLGNNLQVKEAKFPKNVIFSPSIAKPSLICATPVTLGMEMYNYIIDKPKMMRESQHSKKYQSYATSWVEEFPPLKRRVKDSIQERKTKEMRSNIVISLYSLAVELYLAEAASEQNIEEICKCFLALSVETVCFVCNIPNTTFEEISKSIMVNPLELYKANQFYYRFDKTMPTQLRNHFVEIENRFIHSELWKTESSLELLQSECVSQSSISQMGQQLLTRTLQETVEQLSKLAVGFKLSAQITEEIFRVMKSLICFQTSILSNHHLDQLILCSLYGVCKSQKMEIKFNDIKCRYEELNPSNKSQHSDIMCNVEIDSTSRGDIIKFYNTVFIGMAKGYIKQTCSDGFQRHNKMLRLRMRDIPPKDIVLCSMRGKGKNRYKEDKGGKYCNTRRVIDFEEERSHLNRIEEGSEDEEVQSVKREAGLLRSGRSNPSLHTAKTEYYSWENTKNVGL